MNVYRDPWPRDGALARCPVCNMQIAMPRKVSERSIHELMASANRGMEPCHSCKGSGVVEWLVKEDVTDGHACPTCDGIGEIEAKPTESEMSVIEAEHVIRDRISWMATNGYRASLMLLLEQTIKEHGLDRFMPVKVAAE